MATAMSRGSVGPRMVACMRVSSAEHPRRTQPHRARQELGWPIKEAIVGAPNGISPGQTVDGYTYPVAWWATSEASPSGIVVTDEAVYVAALRGQRVWRVPLTPDGVGVPHVLLSDLGRIRLVAQGPDGNLYVLTSNTTGTGLGVGVDAIVRLTVVEDSA